MGDAAGAAVNAAVGCSVGVAVAEGVGVVEAVATGVARDMGAGVVMPKLAPAGDADGAVDGPLIDTQPIASDATVTTKPMGLITVDPPLRVMDARTAEC